MDLDVDLSGPAEVPIGGLVPFTLTVKNNGPNIANNVQVAQVLPANTIFDPGASTPGLTMEPLLNSVFGKVQSLAVGASRSFTIFLRPTVAAQGTLSTTALAGADEVLLEAATDTVTSKLIAAPVVRRVARYGASPSQSFLVITFDKPMDAASAENRANYRVSLPGRDGRLGTRDDQRVAINGAFYDNSKRQVTLALGRRVPLSRLRLFVSGNVDDSKGVRLAGNGSGLPGVDYVANFGREIYAGPASKLLNPSKPPRKR